MTDKASSPYVTLTADNFDQQVLNSDQPVMVDFWATWCPPCRAVAPAIEELASEFEGSAVVAKLDVDEEQALAAKYGIQSIPTMLFFKGGEIVDRMAGAAPKGALAAKLEALTTASAAA